ncbi:MAG TPA: SUKH-3 domain-containing protein [Candidatus Saccharimonadales bacterium]|nr:SUKH-3 domain-containing protein [Candidatus Saccharimonadales bacterium]
MTRFSRHSERVLRKAGWYPGRQVPELVSMWKNHPFIADIEMFETAERFLLEFGGITVTQSGPGVTSARSPFEIDPTLAAYQSDLFKEFGRMVDTRLYPLGEAAHGYYFLAIGENGRVYYVMQDIVLAGYTEDEALENLLIGRRVTPSS